MSRDQLGIQPSKWKFDKKSNEPYTGTGPYKITKENNSWFLNSNPFYRSQDEIKCWKVELIDTAKNNYPIELPDLILLATNPVKVILNKTFVEINKSQQEFRYFPGWVPEFTEFMAQGLIKKSTAFKYSYKLIDYQEKERGGLNVY